MAGRGVGVGIGVGNHVKGFHQTKSAAALITRMQNTDRTISDLCMAPMNFRLAISSVSFSVFIGMVFMCERLLSEVLATRQ